MSALKPAPEHHDSKTLFASLATIPTHDPARYETTDGFDNPKCTNGDRASFATGALDAFQKICNTDEDIETTASDLICDLFHLLHSNQRDPLPVLHRGIHAFLCEAGEIRPIRDHS
jgi:hypothetical protein